jgi:molybdopterin converting factor small subunit
MRVHVILTGPPRVVLGRSAVDLDLSGTAGTLADLLAALAVNEPRIARYVQHESAGFPGLFRPLLGDRLMEADTPIPDGATVTLLFAVAGG